MSQGPDLRDDLLHDPSTQLDPAPEPPDPLPTRRAIRAPHVPRHRNEAAAGVTTRRAALAGGVAAVGLIGSGGADVSALLDTSAPRVVSGPAPDVSPVMKYEDRWGPSREMRRPPGTPAPSPSATTVASDPEPEPAPAAKGRAYTGFAAAARAARPRGVGPLDVSDPMQNLVRKATFGYRPSDLADLRTKGIDAWLTEQLDPSLADPLGDQAWKAFPLAGNHIAAIRARTELYSWDAMFDTVYATLGRQIMSRRQLYEVVVDIFTNRLHVPMPAEVWSTGPSFYRNVIRANAFGRYEDMLLAAMRHPAMLLYLTNVESNRDHVNENLGRELLELHTVGRTSGYTESHVKSSARVLSGRTIDWNTDQFVYNPDLHAVGKVSVLGWSNANASASAGLALGDAYLRYLARHPATARALARTFAVRFVSDNPPDSLVTRMANAYSSHGTAILPMLEVMFRSSEFWDSAGQKVRRPHEDAVATARILDLRSGSDFKGAIIGMYWNLYEVGQPPLGWAPPNGYPDVAAAWLNAGSMLGRWNTHRRISFGWYGGMTSPRPEQLISGIEGLTVAQFVDRACVRLTGQKFNTKDRATLIGSTGLASGARIEWHSWSVANTVVPLILDSVYFQVR